jgi:hypothetical protein
MSARTGWSDLRARRMTEPGAAEAYEATRLAFDLGRAVRELRERHGLSQAQLAPTTERSGPSYAHTRGRPRKYTRHDWISVSPFADAVPRGFQLTSAARYVVQLSCDSDMNCSHEGVPALFVQLMAN